MHRIPTGLNKTFQSMLFCKNITVQWFTSGIIIAAATALSMVSISVCSKQDSVNSKETVQFGSPDKCFHKMTEG